MSIQWKSYAAGVFAGALLISCAEPRREPEQAVQVATSALIATSTVSASGDTYVKSGSPNQNQASEPIIRLQSSGKNRGLLFFDASALRNAVGTGTLRSARLELTIDNAATNWGTGRPIALHRLKKASAEYSATWNCAIDATISNSAADCSGATAWDMNSTDANVQPWLSPAIGTTVITSGQLGTVSFDVTADVAAIVSNSWPGYGFLLKKVDESASGLVEFVARERGPAARIVLEVDSPTGASGSGGGGTGAGLQSASLLPTKDSHVREGEPNQNFGTSPILRIQASGRNRGILEYDTAQIGAAVGTDGVAAAHLELTITQTFSNWGPDRSIGVHRLKDPWTELGATWNCGIDSDPSNSTDSDCSSHWVMWNPNLSTQQISWVEAPTSTALISSGQTGVVRLDVTKDVACGVAGYVPFRGFIVKKEAESQSGHIEFASRETATPAVLVVEHAPGAAAPVNAGICAGTLLPDGGVPDAGTSDAGTCTVTGVDDDCDNVDDDCDHKIDEAYKVVDTQCGQGVCRATGERSCVAGVVTDSCVAGTASGADTSCDGIDQDCDGRVDEAYAAQATSCGQGACARTGQRTCSGGSTVDSCTAGATTGSDNDCDGIDDDCDGKNDESYAAQTTSCGTGVCARSGQRTCVQGAAIDSCTAGAATGTDADCDGVDQDCDGRIDEAYTPQATTCGLGACARTGQRTCSGGSTVDSCTAGASTGSDNDCDGIDDDCDGSTDESYTVQATTCGTGVCTRSGQRTCAQGVQADSCSAGTATGADADCDGVDQDCDGRADESYGAHPTTCGQGACVRSGDRTCVNGITTDSCAPGTPAANDATCNGIDDDCNGTVDDGYGSLPTTCGVGSCRAHGATRCVSGSVIDSCTPGSPSLLDYTCDGHDDDCDGTNDENYFPRATSCGAGACAATGLSACVGGVETTSCTPSAAAPTDITCDGIDDDCDGRTDDDFVVATTNCGTGACARTGQIACVAGAVRNTCVAGIPKPSDASCNGADDDCDGHTDENFVPSTTTCGRGSCLASGSTGCQNGAIVDLCVPGTAATADSSCDGRDQDCDGMTDEDFRTSPTTCGTGACSAAGVSYCDDGVIRDTCAIGPAQALDVSCNGVDDDCDGAIDDDYVGVATECGVGACRALGTRQCLAGHVVDSCTPHSASAQDATCNGVDDDCDGIVDEDFVSQSVTCGVGACQATGITGCLNGVPQAFCVPLVASAHDATCNGVDDDCDGINDEDYASSSTTCGLGACARTGGTACVAGNVTSTCIPGLAQPLDNQCDGIDSDCDGRVDEDFAGQSTSCGVGACARTGSTHCVSGTVGEACVPGSPGASDATCDGIDDDCDGKTDESYIATCSGSVRTFCQSGAVVSANCVDTDQCNGTETCTNGTCQPGAPIAGYDDGNPCTIDSCPPGSLTISHQPVAQGTSCSDGNFCNGAETCQPGGGPPGCPLAPSGLINLWRGEGNDNDSVGNANGTPTNGQTFAAGHVGQALVFDNVDDFVKLDTFAAALSAPLQATFELWLKPSSDTCHTIINISGTSGTTLGLQVGAGCTATSNTLITFFRTAPSGRIIVSSTLQFATSNRALLFDGAFHHIALTFDGTTTRCYLDAAEVPVTLTGTVTGVWGGLASPNTASLGAQRSTLGSPTKVFHGQLDEVSLYNRALTATEISGIYAAGTTGKCAGGPGTGMSCSPGTAPTITSDGNPCTQDACDPTLGIVHPPTVSGSACNDNNVCTLSDHCDGAGTCTGSPASTSTTCNDLTSCTTSDHCNGAGACTGTPIPIDDSDPCTVDGCSDATGGVTHEPASIGASCSDGLFCNGPETCQACSSGSPGCSATRVCTAGTPPALDDANGCTTDACDESSDSVTHAPLAAGSACSDLDLCTVSDRCDSAGQCSGDSVSCTGINLPCTQDADCRQVGEGALCLLESEWGIPGGSCTRPCDENPCAAGSACTSLLGHVAPSKETAALTGRYCIATCTTNAQCTHPHEACGFDFDGFKTCSKRCTQHSDCDESNICRDGFCEAAEPTETNCADREDTDRDGLIDCADPDCAGSPNCGENCFNNVDDDADGQVDCHDTECGTTCESCFGELNVDDDGDSLADCADPDCAQVYICQETTDITCRDGVDNDRDGLADCADIDCLAADPYACREVPFFSCTDGKDNDADGLVDCADPNCAGEGICREDTAASCSDGHDNDYDGHVDCDDSGCQGVGSCTETTNARCSDGLDNDHDGSVDCSDSDCSLPNGVSACSEQGSLNCSDGIDNDHDGKKDCLDSSCACFERCDDGIDNDGNGAADCADPAHCVGDPLCAEICDDGIDNNGVFGADCMDPNCFGYAGCIELDCSNGIDDEHDGRTDCNDPDCSTSPACPEICDNGVDDNADLRADCADADCAALYRCQEAQHCDDGLDNDRDTRIDCGDPQCAGAPECNEALHCRDSIDNDHDGSPDCSDSDCAGGPPCVAEICGNMVDDDGDGMFDCADSDCLSLAGCDDPAPPLSQVATPTLEGAPTTLFDSMAFVYAGPTPTQYFVAANTIVRARAAVVRGAVKDVSGAAMPGVRVRVLHHPEFGETRTTAEGTFTLVVNGGERLTLTYDLAGYIAVQRAVEVSWSEFAFADDVVLTAFDTTVTPIDLTGSTGLQVARGSVTTDADGSRQATLLFPAGVGANLVMADGSQQPMSTLSVRATELTVGSSGHDAMPAELPARTAYTYAVELTADEALASGASRVTFSTPVPFYVEDFIGAPVGSAVPTGYYDREQGTWVASDNGRVIKVLAITSGAAVLDVTGSNSASTANELGVLGITPAELQAIANLYASGQRLWRVPISHFTPWDHNWPFGPPPHASAPPANGPGSGGGGGGSSGGGGNGGSGGSGGSGGGGGHKNDKQDGTKDDCEETQTGSTIGCVSRSLGEDIPLAGTPFHLHYESLAAHGPEGQSSLTVHVTGEDVPEGIEKIVLEVFIAGRRIVQTLPQTPSQTYTFAFDGLDAAGRVLRGTQEARLNLCYEYPLVYYAVADDFEKAFDSVQGDGGAQDATFGMGRLGGQVESCRTWTDEVQLSPGTEIGAWDLDVHHVYDPVLQRVYKGDGHRQGVGAPSASGSTATYVGDAINCTSPIGHTGPLLQNCGLDDAPAANGDKVLRTFAPQDIAVAPDGSMFVLDTSGSSYVSVLDADNQARRVVGFIRTGCTDQFGDDSPSCNATAATRFKLGTAAEIAMGPDGMLYVATELSSSPCATRYIYRFSLDGQVVERVAGSVACSTMSSADGVLATDAKLEQLRGMAFGPDGSLYYGEPYRVRRIGPDGRITTTAGTSTATTANPDAVAVDVFGEPNTLPRRATEFELGNRVTDVAVDSDSNLYLATGGSVFVVTSDGLIHLFAGGAAAVQFANPDPFDPIHSAVKPTRLDVSRSGALSFISASGAMRGAFRVVNGTLLKVAGISSVPFAEGMPSNEVLSTPTSIAVHPDGRILIADTGRGRVVSPAPGMVLPQTNMIPSADGRLLWDFDLFGRHRRTIDATTGATLYQFGYDSGGQLIEVVDVSGNRTKISRDASGRPTAIIPPQAPATTLDVDDNNLLGTVIGPTGAAYSLTYHPGTKLLATFTDPEQNAHRFFYDADGRLRRDEDPAGAVQELLRRETSDGFEVAHSTLETSNSTIYRQSSTLDGSMHSEIVGSDGSVTVFDQLPDGMNTRTLPDGTQILRELAPDPRWQMTAPVPGRTLTMLPSGLTRTTAVRRTVTLTDAFDPLALQQLRIERTVGNDTPEVSTYDVATRTWTIQSPEGRTSRVTLDAQARPLRVQRAGEAELSYTYDARGRLLTRTQGAGTAARTAKFAWRSTDGFLDTVDGPANLDKTTFVPDAAGRAIDIAREDGSHVAVSYDGLGQPLSIAPPGKPAHGLDFTPVGLLEKYVAPAADSSGQPAMTTYVYDTERKLRSIASPDGRSIAYSYDPASGVLVGRSGATWQQAFTYAGSGHLATVAQVDSHGTSSLSYGLDGPFLTAETWSGDAAMTAGVVQRVFDDHFRVDQLKVNGTTVVDYTYDRDDLLTSANALSLQRSPAGVLSGTTLGGVTTQLGYDALAELASTSAQFSSQELFKQTVVSRDEAGRISDLEERGSMAPALRREYRYDLAGRLAFVNAGADQLAGYDYDGNGNRIAYVTASGTVVGSYDAQDRLVRYCPRDAIGNAAPIAGLPCLEQVYRSSGELLRRTNLSTGEAQIYDYDERGALRSVQLEDGRQVDYEVDAYGRRTGKYLNGVKQWGLLYLGALRPIALLDATNHVVAIYGYATQANVPDFMISDGKTYRLVTDHRGSVRLAGC